MKIQSNIIMSKFTNLWSRTTRSFSWSSGAKFLRLGSRRCRRFSYLIFHSSFWELKRLENFRHRTPIVYRISGENFVNAPLVLRCFSSLVKLNAPIRQLRCRHSLYGLTGIARNLVTLSANSNIDKTRWFRNRKMKYCHSRPFIPTKSQNSKAYCEIKR